MHRSAHWLGLSLLLLLPASCLGAKDQALFDLATDPSSGAAASSGGSASAAPGTDSGSSANANVGAGPSSVGGGGAGASVGQGAAASGGNGNGNGAAGSGGGAPPSEAPVIVDCAMVEGATIGGNGHCYRVNDAELTFEQARAACADAGGHLLTIASEEENQLGADLHDGVHWLGAHDGRADTVPGVGTYTWVTAEPWTWDWWEDGQPNAYETNCPDQDDESDCFEHCAFQTDEGDWNDRSCWHTIVSICEWDVEPKTPDGDAGGAAGAGGAEP